MKTFNVHLDYETSERAGAGGMFQVISIRDENDVNQTELIDQGVHYSDLESLARDLAKTLKMPKENIKLIQV